MNFRLVTVSSLMLALSLLSAARADPSAIAQREINYLLGYIEGSGCEFYRNGSWYDSKRAEAHLRNKYEYLADRNLINFTEDFIEKAATKSSFSDRPYEIRCSGGEAVASNQWLRKELAHYRALQ
jgi:hypothetical protein